MSTIAPSSTAAQALATGRRTHRHLASHFDYALTYATSCLTSVCGMAAFRFAHQNLGETGFAEYALMRRALAFLVPLLSLGMAVAIARSVACRVADSRYNDSIKFLGGGVLLTLISVSAFSISVFVFPKQISFLCTGVYERANLVQRVLPLICGLLLTICCSAYCRGRMWIGASNAIQLVCVGMVPTLVLFLVRDLETFLCWSGCAVCAVSGCAVTMLYLARPGATRRLPLSAVRSLFRFGAPRVPGDLAFYGLLAAPAIAAAHQAGVRSGGEVAYALAWLTLLGQLVAPLSTLLLPEASYLIRTGQTDVLRRRLIKLLCFSVTVTCVLVGLLAYWAAELVVLHLGACSATLLHNVRLMVAAAIPLNFFICVRSVIDAGESRAVSPALCIGALVAFCVFLLPSYGHCQTAEAAIIAFILALGILALLAAFATYRVLKKHEHVVVDSDH